MGKWKKQPQGAWSHKWIRSFLFRRSDVCGICKKKIEKMKDATIDHIVPISKGGSDRPDNMQLAHDWCNQEKGNSLEVAEAPC